jgi:hypothetical protein
MMSEAQLVQMERDAMAKMPPPALEAFAAFLRAKAFLAGYACSQIGAPADFQSDCRATIRFCNSFADKAEEALSARRADATAQARGDST